jgi:hypothetical protein
VSKAARRRRGGRAEASARQKKKRKETFKKTVTAVAVPLNHSQALTFVTKFMTGATTNGIQRKAYDDNGLKDTPIRAE